MTGPQLCVVNGCRITGRHLPGCPGDCAGCLPRVATDGLRLCGVCTRRIAEDATQSARLYRELEHALTRSEKPGERTSGSPDRARIPNERAVECRTLIRHTLVGWCRLIAEERGWALPPDTVPAMAAYVARSSEWLAGTDYADEAAGELHDLAHGEAYRVAYPSGARRFVVAPCPGCEDGKLIVVLRTTDSLLPSELLCDLDPEHAWPADQWLTLGRQLRKAAVG